MLEEDKLNRLGAQLCIDCLRYYQTQENGSKIDTQHFDALIGELEKVVIGDAIDTKPFGQVDYKLYDMSRCPTHPLWRLGRLVGVDQKFEWSSCVIVLDIADYCDDPAAALKEMHYRIFEILSGNEGTALKPVNSRPKEDPNNGK